MALLSKSEYAPAARASDRFARIHHSQVSGVAARLVAAAAGLVMVPLALGYLGKPAYGLWMVIASVVAWMQLSDFGVSSGTGNALAEANGRGDLKAASSYATTALLCLTGIAAGGICAAFLLAERLPWPTILAESDPSLLAQAPSCFVAVAALFFLTLPLSLSHAVMAAHQRAYVANWLQAAGSLVSLGAVYAAVSYRLPMAAIIIAAGVGQLAVQAVLWASIGRFIPGLTLQPSAVTLDALRRVSRSSIPLFLFQIGALAANELVSIVLAHISTLAAVADYNVLLRLYLSVFALGAALSFPYYPAIREAYERREFVWIRTAVLRVLLTRLGIVAALGLPLLRLGDWLVEAWLGQSLERALGLGGWSIFLACMLLASASSLLSELLTSLDDIWFQVIVVAVTALVVISAMLLLVPGLGVAGVFAAMALSTFFPILVCGLRLRATVAHA